MWDLFKRLIGGSPDAAIVVGSGAADVAAQLERPSRGAAPRRIRRGRRPGLRTLHRPLQSWEQLAAEPATAGGSARETPSTPVPRLTEARNWVYQLQSINWERIEASLADVAVIDYAAEGTDATAFTLQQMARMRTKPGNAGTTRLACYLSIGEAEVYRYYWDAAWSKKQPPWLDAENGDWVGNYKVHYWDPAWQRILIDGPDSYLDRILRAGFDGVYLDIIDAFEYWREKGRADADREMITLVERIAAAARKRNPDFLIIPQNGEELLHSARYRAVISAIGKEDIFFRPDLASGRDAVLANTPEMIAAILADLAPGQADGIPVLAIEYLRDDAAGEAIIPAVTERMLKAGLVPYFGPRRLDRVAPPVSAPQAVPPVANPMT